MPAEVDVFGDMWKRERKLVGAGRRGGAGSARLPGSALREGGFEMHLGCFMNCEHAERGVSATWSVDWVPFLGLSSRGLLGEGVIPLNPSRLAYVAYESQVSRLLV